MSKLPLKYMYMTGYFCKSVYIKDCLPTGKIMLPVLKHIILSTLMSLQLKLEKKYECAVNLKREMKSVCIFPTVRV